MFGKVKITALELAELLGKKIPHPAGTREFAQPSGVSAQRACSGERQAPAVSGFGVGLTAAEIRLLTRPFPESLEITLY